VIYCSNHGYHLIKEIKVQTFFVILSPDYLINKEY
jgi:hypothetical protein